MKIPSIVLASSSPRRIDLLKQACVPVEIVAPGADETPKPREAPRALVRRLALEKARSVEDEVRRHFEKALIISADTIVVAPGGKTKLGKPRDAADARKMLKSLAGRRHIVWTGYCILPVGLSGKKPGKPWIRAVSSGVWVRNLSSADIARYVSSEEPMDKAGSYAAQGLGMALIERIDGSYTNVVGLPMSQLLTDLQKEFGIPLFPDLKV